MTPTALDYLAEYKDGVHRMDFQLDQNNAGQPCAYTRDAVDSQPPAAGTLTGTKTTAFISYPNNNLAFDVNRPAATAYYHKPRGAWKLEALSHWTETVLLASPRLATPWCTPGSR